MFTSPFGELMSLTEIAGDVRFALRYFSRHKATTAIIVVVILLSTGANTLFFSMFQSQFLRPAPAVPDDDAVVRIWSQERATKTAAPQQRGVTQSELTALSARREMFADVAAWAED